MKKQELAVNRRTLVMSLASTAVIAAGSHSSAHAAEDHADFLFVQTSKGMTFDAATKTLTLKDVSPTTLFFADRPERIAGNMTTAAFLPFWGEGADSFLSDPPNADISVLDGETLHQTVAVLMDPRLDGSDLIYTVKTIEGTFPATGENVSVFIDVIGMPLTPLSFAGARRRGFRRAYMYR
ncbi:hypothetical protein [Labrenzia sp. 011]|uniref:hypothetical protein n=1 Tax=Labrenzia sp. 011 TaxID=2171494 RepID=UPI000D50CB92|nr:hypothetical protein [Labrenzia sp. 011]PVB63186.1 hypothetical protein DCO57_04845 [Labrenzia sp. 011]